MPSDTVARTSHNAANPPPMTRAVRRSLVRFEIVVVMIGTTTRSTQVPNNCRHADRIRWPAPSVVLPTIRKEKS